MKPWVVIAPWHVPSYYDVRAILPQLNIVLDRIVSGYEERLTNLVIWLSYAPSMKDVAKRCALITPEEEILLKPVQAISR